MSLSFRFRGAWLAVPMVLVLVGCGGNANKASTAASTIAPGGTTTSSSTAGTLNVMAGLNDPKDPNIAVTEYLPESVTIAAGNTVEWRIAGPEPHSVTYFPPGQQPPPPGSDESLFAPKPLTGPFDGKTLVNSGLAPQGPGAVPPFRITFPTPGKFTFYCVIHPGMTGTVTVVDANGKADTQAEVKSRADAETAKWLDEGRAAKKKLVETPPASQRGADGTTTYKVQMGTTTEHTDVLAFAPPEATLKPGDKVTFVNNSQAPHTASFAGKTQLPQNPNDPAATKPAPGPSPQTLNLDAFFNTGTLPPNAGPPGQVPPEAARSFTFVARDPGTYNYVCIFHVGSGMGGSLKVA